MIFVSAKAVAAGEKKSDMDGASEHTERRGHHFA